MESEIARTTIRNLITHIETCRETQCEIDDIYERLCEIIKPEMNDAVPVFTPKRKTRRTCKHKYAKPYWNDKLQSL